MNKKAATDAVKEWFPEWKHERDRLDEIDKWQRGDNPELKAPRAATAETKKLIELARSPWMGLVVATCSQAMYVDGVRGAGSAPEPDGPITGPWRTWMANGMNARQIAVHRAALGFGYSFVTVLPGEAAGQPTAFMCGVSPRKMFAVYADPAVDDWPMFTIQFEKAGADKYAVRVMDETTVSFLSCDASGTGVEWISESTHGIGVTPAVRYTNLLDLDGRTLGEVQPFVPLAQRIDKTNYDRLVTQHFNSWKKLWVAGMAEPETDQEANRVKLRLAQDDILIAEDHETKFGAFPASELNGYIQARDADVKELAATSQTPAYALTGDLVNLSAEALAAARSTLDLKVLERKTSFGVSHAQALRLAARIEGNTIDAEDVSLEVTWQDTTIRSLSAAADALGKIATQLGVPPEELWQLIPGVTKTTVDQWKRTLSEGDSMGRIADLLEQATAPTNPVGTT